MARGQTHPDPEIDADPSIGADSSISEGGVGQVLGEAVAGVSGRFRSHGGGIALRGVRDGHVEVAFTGFCTGCACRPQCLAATVEPALLAVPGVRSVEATGVRLDGDARARLSAFLGMPGVGAGS